MSLTVAYVAHALSAPTREGMLQNGRNAARWCAWLCCNFQVATVADWIVMSSVLDETPENRAMGLACDVAIIPRCDVLILVGLRISEGMKIETATADEADVDVIDLTALGVGLPSDDAWFVEAVAKILDPFGIERQQRSAA